MKLTTPLRPSEIELRIGSVSESRGFSLLAYKTARTDRNRLDEVIGCMKWQNKHYVDNHGNVVCKIGIWYDDIEQWIWKEDTGAESMTEKEKGSYSDSFKRAGFRWGIGIELYDFPFIWIPWRDGKWKPNRNGKLVPAVYTRDWKIAYEGKSFKDGMVIYDKNDNIMWSNVKNKKPQKKEIPPDQPQRKRATSKKFVPEKSKDVARQRIKRGFDFLEFKKDKRQDWIDEYLPVGLYDATIDDLNELLKALEKEAKGKK